MYLQPDQVMQMLGEIGACAPGSSIVFDYCVHRAQLSEAERAGLDAVAAGLAAQGEQLHSSFAPPLLAHMLRHHGFRHVEDLGAAELEARYGARLSGIFRLMCATV